jgi:hypothetical protein
MDGMGTRVWEAPRFNLLAVGACDAPAFIALRVLKTNILAMPKPVNKIHCSSKRKKENEKNYFEKYD